MFSFRRATAFILLSGCFSLSGSFAPLLREMVVPSLEKIQGNVFYAQTNYYFDSNQNLPISFIQILGARVRYLQYLNGPTSDKMLVRAISRSKYSLRARASCRWLCSSFTVLKLIQNQSWYSVWWNGFDHTNESCNVFISTSGPCIDTTTGTFSEGMTEIKKFFLELKKTSISEEEVELMKEEISTFIRDRLNTLTKEESAEQVWDGGTKLSHLYENAVCNVPIPLMNLMIFHMPQFSIDRAEAFLEEWKSCPLEILVVGDMAETTANFVSEAHHLVSLITPTFESEKHLPYMDCGVSETISARYSVPSSLKNTPWISIAYFNFGSLSARTLIAAEMAKQVFPSVANTNIKYLADWTIRGGCVIFTIKMDHANSTELPNGDHSETLQADVDKVRHHFEPLKMEESLATGGELETSRTVGPHLKSFMAAGAFPAERHAFTNAIDWLMESFEGERSFEELNNINIGLADGSINMSFLVDNLRMILVERLRTDNPNIASYYTIAGLKQ